MDSTSYCFDPLSSRRIPPTSHGPPPPPPPSSHYHHHTNSDSDHVLSPPLTPALSPSVTMANNSYKRKFSTDPVGCYSLTNYPDNCTSSTRQGYGLSVDRRPSSCTTMSMDECQQHPYWANNTHPEKPRSMSFSDRTSPRRQPTKQNKHLCTYPHCGWSFKRYEHLKRHMLVHTGERPHACPHPGCGKRFSRSDNFHAHYRTHTKKALEQKETLNTTTTTTTQYPSAYNAGYPRTMLSDQERYPFQFHMRPPMSEEHLRGTPACHRNSTMFLPPEHDQRRSADTAKESYCESPLPSSAPSLATTFSSTSSSSEEEKQHICPHNDCQRRFKRLEHLKRHMRIHTLERPFECTYAGCQKTFSRSDNLTQHLKTHERRESRYSQRVMSGDYRSYSMPQPSSGYGESLSYVDLMRPSSSSSPSSSTPPTPHHMHNTYRHTQSSASSPYKQPFPDVQSKDESSSPFHNNSHHHRQQQHASPPVPSSMHMLSWQPTDATR